MELVATVQLPPFARLLRRHRLQADLTQEDLAEQAGLSARAISDLERGVKTRPHRVTIELLADALGLAGDERAELLAAVPRTTGQQAGELMSPADRLSSALGPVVAVDATTCPPRVREVLEGLVGLYVDEHSRNEQTSVTVVIFSVPQSVAID